MLDLPRETIYEETLTPPAVEDEEIPVDNVKILKRSSIKRIGKTTKPTKNTKNTKKINKDGENTKNLNNDGEKSKNINKDGEKDVKSSTGKRAESKGKRRT